MTHHIGSLLLLSFITSNAFAHDHHDHTTLTGQSEGVALSLAASQHHFDFGTHSWQGSVGMGSYDNDSAISFGLAKRFDRVLINGSVGVNGDKSGYGMGVNWRF